MDTEFSQTDVVVIGGGMAGLATAAYLARGGAKVTLFEKSAGLGGRAASQNHDGFIFNRGVHALYTGAATTEVLRELGVNYSYGVPKDTFLFYKGQFYPFPAGVSTLLSNHLLSFGDKMELARFFSVVPFMKPESVAHMSVQEWIERNLKRPLVRQFMVASARPFVYSAALDLVSADAFVAKLQLALKYPVHYIDGGWQSLVDGLRRVAEQAGVRIETGSRVAAVDYQQGRVLGVRLGDGRMLTARSVVIAATPQEALKLVDDGNYAPLRAIVDPLMPGRIACLDIAVRRMPDPRHPIVVDMERPRFFTTQSRYARIAPEGGEVISSFKQLDPREPADPQQDERDLEDLLDTAQPGWRDLVVKRVFLPRIEAVGMLPLAASGGYAGRPGPRVPGIANLYLAGDWIGSGFLSDTSMASAREVARLILREGSYKSVKRATAA